MKFIVHAAASLLCAPACAATYDASTQFSTSQNSQTSTWAYGYNTSGAHGNYVLLPSVANEAGVLGAMLVPGNATQWQAVNAVYPCWYRSGTTARICNNPNANMAVQTFLSGSPAVEAAVITPAKSVVLSPASSGLTAVSFLVPAAGFATVNYAFMANDYSCALPGSKQSYSGSHWSIDHNATVATQGSLVTRSPFAYGTTGNLNIGFSVSVGDRITFTVAANAGNPNCATTVLNASIAIGPGGP